MNSLLKLGVTLILVLQVFGRPSNVRSNRLTDNMAYDIITPVYRPRDFDTGATERDTVEAGRDDTMFEEKARVPSENLPVSHSSNDQMIYNEDRGLGYSENDDSSVKGYETYFQNHHKAQANIVNDGSDPRDALYKRARLRIPCSHCCSYYSCAVNYDHICQCNK